MVPKLRLLVLFIHMCFRAVLFRMVPKQNGIPVDMVNVLELCCFEWFQNWQQDWNLNCRVLELCCFEWFQNLKSYPLNGLKQFQSCVVSNGSKTLALKWHVVNLVLELCCFEWFQNRTAINTLYTESFRAVLFRMVPKPMEMMACQVRSFRAVLFRMVPKQL